MKKSNVVAMRPIKTIQDSLSMQETFRQKRVENAQGELTLKIAGQDYRLVNWSRTGLAFEVAGPQSPFPVNMKIGPVEIFVGNIRVYQGDIEVRSHRNADQDKITIGAEFKSQLFLVEGINAAGQVNLFKMKLSFHTEEMKSIDPEVSRIILDMASSLRILKETCEEQEKRLQNLTLDERNEILAIFLPQLSSEVKKLLNGFSRTLAEVIDIDNLPENTTYHRLFEENIYPFFKSADLTRRAFEKPRGYAGDFEMMNAMYRNGYEGSDLLGKIIHNYTANEDSSESVQFRKPYFISQIESVLDHPGDKNILSIACGPAIEIQEIVKRWPQDKLDRLNVSLFDLDRAALEHAQTKLYQTSIDSGKSPNIDFINASVKAFLSSADSGNANYDLIYSGGLFDYLDNLTSKAIVQRLVKFLSPHGKIIIGNFTKANTSKALCHLITRWHLIHKTEEEMIEWISDLKDYECRFDYDPNKINAFINIKKKM